MYIFVIEIFLLRWLVGDRFFHVDINIEISTAQSMWSPSGESFSIDGRLVLFHHFSHHLFKCFNDRFNRNPLFEVMIQTTLNQGFKLVSYSDPKYDILFLLDDFQELFLVLGVPWSPSLEDFIKNDSQRPDVALFAVIVGVKRFWAHVKGRADIIFLLSAFALFYSRKSKIGNFR